MGLQRIPEIIKGSGNAHWRLLIFHSAYHIKAPRKAKHGTESRLGKQEVVTTSLALLCRAGTLKVVLIGIAGMRSVDPSGSGQVAGKNIAMLPTRCEKG